MLCGVRVSRVTASGYFMNIIFFFQKSIAVIETFPISSNPSSHGPARYVEHSMGSFAYASSTTFFARKNCAVLYIKVFMARHRTTFRECLPCVVMATAYGDIIRLLFQDQPHLICYIPPSIRLVNNGILYQTK